MTYHQQVKIDGRRVKVNLPDEVVEPYLPVEGKAERYHDLILLLALYYEGKKRGLSDPVEEAQRVAQEHLELTLEIPEGC